MSDPELTAAMLVGFRRTLGLSAQVFAASPARDTAQSVRMAVSDEG